MLKIVKIKGIIKYIHFFLKKGKVTKDKRNRKHIKIPDLNSNIEIIIQNTNIMNNTIKKQRLNKELYIT